MDDWLQDPLIKEGSFEYKQPTALNGQIYEKWRTFHFATRLKLDGADYFCRLLLGAASMPTDLGLPLLAHRLTKWYLDAFFFELMSAYDTLLQEINVLYKVKLDIDKVNWESIKGKLSSTLKILMEKERETEWFKKLRWYRNTTTHHAYVPISSFQSGSGEHRLDYDYHEVSLQYFDNKTGQVKEEKLDKACPLYLKNMIRHIQTVWQKLVEEFNFS